MALAGGPVDFDLVLGAGGDAGADKIALGAVPDELCAADAAKRPQSGHQVNGFQDVGFSLRVVAQQQVEAGGEIGLHAFVVAEVPQL